MKFESIRLLKFAFYRFDVCSLLWSCSHFLCIITADDSWQTGSFILQGIVLSYRQSILWTVHHSNNVPAVESNRDAQGQIQCVRNRIFLNADPTNFAMLFTSNAFFSTHKSNIAIWSGFFVFVLFCYHLFSDGDFSFLMVRSTKSIQLYCNLQCVIL